MPVFDEPQLLDALSTPVGDLLTSVASGVAAAQRDLDMNTLATYREVYGGTDPGMRELQRIGWRPTWYQIPEVEAEISIALTVTGSSETTGPARMKAYAAPVDAGYSSRYNFELKAASRVRFKIVPVPEPATAERVQLVPALVGLRVEQAKDLLVALGLPASFPATALPTSVVTSQSPTAGALFDTSSIVLTV